MLKYVEKGWILNQCFKGIQGDVNLTIQPPGGRLNKKDGLTRYGNSHVKDKTSLWPSYL